MSNLSLGMRTSLTVLEQGMMKDRIFGLDMQLLIDACILAIAVFVLFLFLSYLLFNPCRELLQKRREAIQNDMDTAAREKEKAEKFKTEYDARLKVVDKEADEILSQARKQALKRENEMIEEAKKEAAIIIERANKDIELEKSKVVNEVKQEIIQVASVMAGKMVSQSISTEKQDELIEEALREMGDETWLS